MRARGGRRVARERVARAGDDAGLLRAVVGQARDRRRNRHLGRRDRERGVRHAERRVDVRVVVGEVVLVEAIGIGVHRRAGDRRRTGVDNILVVEQVAFARCRPVNVRSLRGASVDRRRTYAIDGDRDRSLVNREDGGCGAGVGAAFSRYRIEGVGSGVDDCVGCNHILAIANHHRIVIRIDFIVTVLYRGRDRERAAVVGVVGIDGIVRAEEDVEAGLLLDLPGLGIGRLLGRVASVGNADRRLDVVGRAEAEGRRRAFSSLDRGRHVAAAREVATDERERSGVGDRVGRIGDHGADRLGRVGDREGSTVCDQDRRGYKRIRRRDCVAGEVDRNVAADRNRFAESDIAAESKRRAVGRCVRRRDCFRKRGVVGRDTVNRHACHRADDRERALHIRDHVVALRHDACRRDVVSSGIFALSARNSVFEHILAVGADDCRRERRIGVAGDLPLIVSRDCGRLVGDRPGDVRRVGRAVGPDVAIGERRDSGVVACVGRGVAAQGVARAVGDADLLLAAVDEALERGRNLDRGRGRLADLLGLEVVDRAGAGELDGGDARRGRHEREALGHDVAAVVDVHLGRARNRVVEHELENSFVLARLSCGGNPLRTVPDAEHAVRRGDRGLAFDVRRELVVVGERHGHFESVCDEVRRGFDGRPGEVVILALRTGADSQLLVLDRGRVPFRLREHAAEVGFDTALAVRLERRIVSQRYGFAEVVVPPEGRRAVYDGERRRGGSGVVALSGHCHSRGSRIGVVGICDIVVGRGVERRRAEHDRRDGRFELAARRNVARILERDNRCGDVSLGNYHGRRAGNRLAISFGHLVVDRVSADVCIGQLGGCVFAILGGGIGHHGGRRFRNGDSVRITIVGAFVTRGRDDRGGLEGRSIFRNTSHGDQSRIPTDERVGVFRRGLLGRRLAEPDRQRSVGDVGRRLRLAHDPLDRVLVHRERRSQREVGRDRRREIVGDTIELPFAEGASCLRRRRIGRGHRSPGRDIGCRECLVLGNERDRVGLDDFVSRGRLVEGSNAAFGDGGRHRLEVVGRAEAEGRRGAFRSLDRERHVSAAHEVAADERERSGVGDCIGRIGFDGADRHGRVRDREFSIVRDRDRRDSVAGDGVSGEVEDQTLGGDGERCRRDCRVGSERDGRAGSRGRDGVRQRRVVGRRGRLAASSDGGAGRSDGPRDELVGGRVVVGPEVAGGKRYLGLIVADLCSGAARQHRVSRAVGDAFLHASVVEESGLGDRHVDRQQRHGAFNAALEVVDSAGAGEHDGVELRRGLSKGDASLREHSVGVDVHLRRGRVGVVEHELEGGRRTVGRDAGIGPGGAVVDDDGSVGRRDGELRVGGNRDVREIRGIGESGCQFDNIRREAVLGRNRNPLEIVVHVRSIGADRKSRVDDGGFAAIREHAAEVGFDIALAVRLERRGVSQRFGLAEVDVPPVRQGLRLGGNNVEGRLIGAGVGTDSGNGGGSLSDLDVVRVCDRVVGAENERSVV